MSIISTNESLGRALRYDPNGNLVSFYDATGLNQYRIEYNHANKPIRTVSFTLVCDYSYDDWENLNSKNCSDGSRVAYVIDPFAHHGPSIISEIINEPGGLKRRHINYYHALYNGLTAMQHVETVVNSYTRNRFYFYHYDENWSTNLVSNENGNVVSSYKYDPFGSITSSYSEIDLDISSL
jgi:hypothetical protein